MEREFLLRKLIEHEPSTIDLIQHNNEPKYKKRKNSSSDASSIIKPLSKKMKTQSTLKKQSTHKLPITIDGITLLNLGRIVYDRPAYYNDSYIYPIGYKISRSYNNTTYVLRITDNGAEPRFEAFLTSIPSCLYSEPTPEECVSRFVRFDSLSRTIDGHEMFGLSNNKIRDLINTLPNSRRLIKIKQEIKQENLLSSTLDDNACSYMMPSK